MGLNPENAIRISLIKVGRQKKGKYIRRERFYTYNCIGCNEEISFVKSDLEKVSGRCRKCADNDSGKASSIRFRKEPYRALYNRFIYDRGRAEQTTDITFETFLEYTKIKECHYCGEDITWAEFALAKNGYKYNLDRKDNNLGYLQSNVVVCCWRCNETKSNRFTYEQFLQIGALIKSWKSGGSYGD